MNCCEFPRLVTVSNSFRITPSNSEHYCPVHWEACEPACVYLLLTGHSRLVSPDLSWSTAEKDGKVIPLKLLLQRSWTRPVVFAERLPYCWHQCSSWLHRCQEWDSGSLVVPFMPRSFVGIATPMVIQVSAGILFFISFYTRHHRPAARFILILYFFPAALRRMRKWAPRWHESGR